VLPYSLFRKAHKFTPTTLNGTTYQKTETLQNIRAFLKKIVVVVVVVVVIVVVIVVVVVVVVVVHSFHLHKYNVDRQYGIKHYRKLSL
jgi:ABC-type antimicrobial peptide transport system permease subunit